jgi:hypothetical protein
MLYEDYCLLGCDGMKCCHITSPTAVREKHKNMFMEGLCVVRGSRSDEYEEYCLKNAGASTSHNPMGLYRLLQG